jgi:hypothetical protein
MSILDAAARPSPGNQTFELSTDRVMSDPLAVALGPDDHHPMPNSLPSYPDSEMVDDDEIQSEDKIHSHLTNGGPSYFAMDEAFCARMRAAIAAGLENAPIGVVTTPGTKNPIYVPAEPLPLASSQRAMEHA